MRERWDNNDGLLCEVAQLLQSVKQDWEQANAWSEWDQSVMDRFSSFRAARLDAEPDKLVSDLWAIEDETHSLSTWLITRVETALAKLRADNERLAADNERLRAPRDPIYGDLTPDQRAKARELYNSSLWLTWADACDIATGRRKAEDCNG